jgi:hypothetical protein
MPAADRRRSWPRRLGRNLRRPRGWILILLILAGAAAGGWQFGAFGIGIGLLIGIALLGEALLTEPGESRRRKARETDAAGKR